MESSLRTGVKLKCYGCKNIQAAWMQCRSLRTLSSHLIVAIAGDILGHSCNSLITSPLSDFFK